LLAAPAQSKRAATTKQAQTFANQSHVTGVRDPPFLLGNPILEHALERPERMGIWRDPPHPAANKPAITTSCCSSGNSRAEVPGKHRSNSIAWSSSSAAKSRTVGSPSQSAAGNLVLTLKVLKADLQNRESSLGVPDRRHPRASLLNRTERRPHRQPPSFAQAFN